MASKPRFCNGSMIRPEHLCNATIDNRNVRIVAIPSLCRFKIWAGNLGIFAPGNASADHRLRDDQDVKEVIIQMLDRLRQRLKQAIDPPILEEDEDHQENDDDSEGSESSMAISLDRDSEADANTKAEERSDSGDISGRALADVDDILTRLYTLSAIIRKRTSSNENVKVAKFIAKEDETPESEEYKASRATLPTAAHQRKSSPFLAQKATSVKSSSQTLQFSATDASSVDRLKFASYPKSIALSGLTKSAVARREQLDVPCPPVLGSEQSKEAICPYCFHVVDKEEMRHAKWTDIEPFTESQLPILVKKSARPSSDLFTSLALDLRKDNTVLDMFGVCPLCPFTVDPGAPSMSQSLEVERSVDADSKKIRDHIAGHLESIALLSLPERDDLEDATTNERETGDQQDDSHHDDHDLPTADFKEDTEGDVSAATDEEWPSDEHQSADLWASVLGDPRVRRLHCPEQAQDPTLRQFVARARRMEMFRIWRITDLPIIIVHDPDGLEVELKIAESQQRPKLAESGAESGARG
ncbi:hypothetical protein DL769_004275 [Monosporascus sp. CRB-8-3]|nr:hypothetical protein DL769_004275 [Monosporascus sp. CRB-8-3]